VEEVRYCRRRRRIFKRRRRSEWKGGKERSVREQKSCIKTEEGEKKRRKMEKMYRIMR
jgi:hypothetical protein